MKTLLPLLLTLIVPLTAVGQDLNVNGNLTVQGTGFIAGTLSLQVAPVFTDQPGTQAALGFGSALTLNGNTTYVDAVNGHDPNPAAPTPNDGTRGRADKPFASVGAALAVTQAGDTVIVRPGTYLISGTPPVISVSDVHIVGQGQCIWTGGPSSNTMLSLTNGSDGFTLDNVEFNGQYAPSPPPPIGPSNGIIEALNLTTTVPISNITIRNCYFHDDQDMPVRFVGAIDSPTVQGCRFERTGNCGISCDSTTVGGTTTDASYPYFEGNILSDALFSQSKGIVLHNDVDNSGVFIQMPVVLNNRVTNYPAMGIEIYGGVANNGALTGRVVGNIVQGCLYGISINGSNDMQIEDNIVTQTGSEASIEMVNSTGLVARNFVNGFASDGTTPSQGTGIEVNGAACVGVRVEDNEVRGCIVSGGTYANADRTFFSRNRLEVPAGSPSVFHLQNSTRDTVNDNVIESEGCQAFIGFDTLGGSYGYRVERNRISGTFTGSAALITFYTTNGGSYADTMLLDNDASSVTPFQQYGVQPVNCDISQIVSSNNLPTTPSTTYEGGFSTQNYNFMANTVSAGTGSIPTLTLAAGNAIVEPGPGDGATLGNGTTTAVYDAKVHLQWGLGFEDIYNYTRMVYDSRTGNLMSSGAASFASFSGNGSGLTSLAAGALSGIVPSANLGTGTASSSTFLRGDGTFAVPPGGPSSELAVSAATTLTSTAVGQTVFCTGAGYTVTLPDPSTCTGQSLSILMDDGLTGLVTLSSASLINTSATRIMHNGESATLYSDGTTWRKSGGQTIPLSITLRHTNNLATAAGWQAVPVHGYVSGNSLMQDGTHDRVQIVRPGNYSCSAFGYNQSNVVSVGVERNSGTFGPDGVANGSGSTNPAGSHTAVVSCVAGDYINLAVFSSAAGTLLGSTSGAYPQLSVVEIPGW